MLSGEAIETAAGISPESPCNPIQFENSHLAAGASLPGRQDVPRPSRPRNIRYGLGVRINDEAGLGTFSRLPL